MGGTILPLMKMIITNGSKVALEHGGLMVGLKQSAMKCQWKGGEIGKITHALEET